MNLTREQAIAEHRKMWNWIADEIERYRTALSIPIMKVEYLRKPEFINKTIISFCFLCDYSIKIEKCLSCPLNDISKAGCLGGLYKKCVNENRWKEQATLARQIANLPERTDV